MLNLTPNFLPCIYYKYYLFIIKILEIILKKWDKLDDEQIQNAQYLELFPFSCVCSFLYEYSVSDPKLF